MEKSKLPIRTVVAIGIGAAVFIILGRFGSIPSGIPNTNIETTYAFLSIMSVIFGPIAGLFIGLIGHVLKDSIFYGQIWFSWELSSGIFGAIVGIAARKINIEEGLFGFKQAIIFNVIQVIGNAIAWFLVAPTLDIVMYGEPVNKVFIQGIAAGVANMITVGIIGTILLFTYAKTRTKTGSLNKEE
ncbi:ECF-type riboflavin transporter substrate-binding protein [Clostridium neuense]|uniref:UPF0397 protein ACJDT4_18820 n=1 Tax=Clostridium neuense TaxID=1728934 RepID=A0ABW8TIS2_9CLOT